MHRKQCVQGKKKPLSLIFSPFLQSPWWTLTIVMSSRDRALRDSCSSVQCLHSQSARLLDTSGHCCRVAFQFVLAQLHLFRLRPTLTQQRQRRQWLLLCIRLLLPPFQCVLLACSAALSNAELAQLKLPLPSFHFAAVGFQLFGIQSCSKSCFTPLSLEYL